MSSLVCRPSSSTNKFLFTLWLLCTPTKSFLICQSKYSSNGVCFRILEEFHEREDMWYPLGNGCALFLCVKGVLVSQNTTLFSAPETNSDITRPGDVARNGNIGSVHLALVDFSRFNLTFDPSLQLILCYPCLIFRWVRVSPTSGQLKQWSIKGILQLSLRWEMKSLSVSVSVVLCNNGESCQSIGIAICDVFCGYKCTAR